MKKLGRASFLDFLVHQHMLRLLVDFFFADIFLQDVDLLKINYGQETQNNLDEIH
jgi:hypothetical protein